MTRAKETTWFDQFVEGFVEIQKASYQADIKLQEELHAQKDDAGEFDDIIWEFGPES
jgi:hypothetical protein